LSVHPASLAWAQTGATEDFPQIGILKGTSPTWEVGKRDPHTLVAHIVGLLTEGCPADQAAAPVPPSLRVWRAAGDDFAHPWIAAVDAGHLDADGFLGEARSVVSGAAAEDERQLGAAECLGARR
jgi:hypothetical protein